MAEKIKLVRQPAGSNQCGQACLAMIVGMSLKAAVSFMGKTGMTRTRDFFNTFKVFGWKHPPRLKRGPPPPGHTGIYLCKVRWRRCHNRSHWVVVEKRSPGATMTGRVLDPDMGVAPYLQAGWISSHMEVKQ